MENASAAYGLDIVVLLALAICAVGFSGGGGEQLRATYSGLRAGASGGRLGSMAGVGSILLVVIIWLLSGLRTASCNMTTIPFLPDRLNREPVVWR